MSKYTKEERIHVRKNVYAFRIFNRFGEGFAICFNDHIIDFINTDQQLRELFRIIHQSDFIDQYYICKVFAKGNGLSFEEFGEKEWKNIPNIPLGGHHIE